MAVKDVTLVAHLMRRAGFGASRTQLDALASKPYEEVVEDLIPVFDKEPVYIRAACYLAWFH